LGLAPSWQNVNDVNGKTLWRRVFQRVDLVTSTNSLLLLNPSNTNNGSNPGGHGGGCRPGFNINGFAVPGVCPDSSTANYTTFQNWILDGGPPGN
jgi:hypothetical protein